MTTPTPTTQPGDRSEPVARLVDILDTPVPAGVLAARLTAAEATHGPGTLLTAAAGRLEVRTAGRICGCRHCDARDRATAGQLLGRPQFGLMIVCETCGNKRCPHAAHHEQTCTGSNAPAQPGSDY